MIEFARRLAAQRPPLWIRFLLVPGWRDDYGVVKMNVDTDMEYVFMRSVAGQMFKKYDGLLKVDGEAGNKKVYDPRSYLALAEAAMAGRVKQAVSDVRGTGKTMFAL